MARQILRDSAGSSGKERVGISEAGLGNSSSPEDTQSESHTCFWGHLRLNAVLVQAKER